jgi:hypothetical protein
MANRPHKKQPAPKHLPGGIGTEVTPDDDHPGDGNSDDERACVEHGDDSDDSSDSSDSDGSDGSGDADDAGDAGGSEDHARAPPEKGGGGGTGRKAGTGAGTRGGRNVPWSRGTFLGECASGEEAHYRSWLLPFPVARAGHNKWRVVWRCWCSVD